MLHRKRQRQSDIRGTNSEKTGGNTPTRKPRYGISPYNSPTEHKRSHSHPNNRIFRFLQQSFDLTSTTNVRPRLRLLALFPNAIAG